MTNHIRIALIGFGAINRRVAALIAEQEKPVQIVAVGVRQVQSSIAGLPGARVLTAPSELESVAADLVVEAASREAVGPWGEAALRHAGGLVLSSSSALADQALLARLTHIAETHDSQLIVSPGAVAGLDAVAAAASIGLDRILHTIVKPPAGWRGTAAETLVDLDHVAEPVTFFTGSARQAALQFPSNANATVATALSSGRGLDATEVELVVAPGLSGNRHIIWAIGAFGTLRTEIENKPLADNPRSSELAALALVRLIDHARPGLRV